MALLFNPANAFSRGCMAGVSRWLAQRPEWAVSVEKTAMLEGGSRERLARAAGGAISWLTPHELPAAWRRSRKPIVFVKEHADTAEELSIASDEDVALRMAVEHLQSQGMRHFGHVPAEARSGAARVAVLRDCAGHRGGTVEVFDQRAARAHFGEWLAALPKPVGIVAGSDSRGVQLVEACREVGLRVPDDVAVVGIGNDEWLCDLAVPGLSSVAHNGVRIGYEACRMLADALGGRHSPRRLLVPPVGMVVRRSSDALAIDDSVVRRALKVIRGTAAEGITPDSVAENAGLPRRTLDRHFQRTLGRTVQEELVATRLALARTLLADTDLKLLSVAVRSGFRDASQLCHSFKSAFGVSPIGYRRQARPWDDVRARRPSRHPDNQ